MRTSLLAMPLLFLGAAAAAQTRSAVMRGISLVPCPFSPSSSQCNDARETSTCAPSGGAQVIDAAARATSISTETPPGC